jgi:hypothetical protein
MLAFDDAIFYLLFSILNSLLWSIASAGWRRKYLAAALETAPIVAKSPCGDCSESADGTVERSLA